MMNLKQIRRILRTVDHLQPSQLLGQCWFRIYAPRPNHRISGLPLRKYVSPWRGGISRRTHLTAPDALCCLNLEFAFPNAGDWENEKFPLLWKYNLHYFDFILHARAKSQLPWIRNLMDRWLVEHPDGTGWQPYPTSLRVVNWIRFHWEIEPLTEEAIKSLVRQTSHLARRIEYHIDANHWFTNGKALLFAGLFFKGRQANSWLNEGLSIVTKALQNHFFPDGGHYERSPMYHRIITEDLLDLYNVLTAFDLPQTIALKKELARKIPQLLRWAQDMSLPNNQFPLFGDSSNGVAPTLSELTEYAHRLGFSSVARVDGHRWLLSSKYCRFEKDRITLFATVGEPSPVYQPGHSHADVLSFELYADKQPLLVDGGVPTYDVCEQRLKSRQTAFHNTLEIDGQDSSEVWSSFRVGRRARVSDVEFNENTDGTAFLTATHDGYRFLKGKPRHRREWHWHGNGVDILDRVFRNSSSSDSHKITIRFRAAPGLSWKQKDNQLWQLHREESIVLSLSCESQAPTKIKVANSQYHPEFNLSQNIEVLEVILEARMPVEVRCYLKVERRKLKVGVEGEIWG